MYESFFGLKEKAFSLTPDPDFLYLNNRTREAFENILYGIERREGFAVVVGDVGTGKTTLCCAFLERIEGKQNIRTVLIQNPMLSELDILRSILQDLGVRPQFEWPGKNTQPTHGGDWTRDLTKKELIDHLNTFLAERAREDAFTVLIIDESQNLSLEMFEQLRLLSNLETTKKKLLQIIFLGQLELAQKLAELPQLSQRISFRFRTEPLSREDTEKYVLHRLAVAEETHRIQFERGAFEKIYRHSKGNPRLINLICDRALREAYRERSFTVRKAMIRKAAASLGGTERATAGNRKFWIGVAAAVLLLLTAAVLGWWQFSGRSAGPVRQPAGPEKRPSTAEQTPAPPPPSSAPAKPPVESRKEDAPPQAPRSLPRFYLQVYSFRTAEGANKAARDLEALNFPSRIIHQPGAGDEGWYAVYVGPFDDPESAQRAAADLSRAVGTTPVLREHGKN